jgi:hypothetical protein
MSKMNPMEALIAAVTRRERGLPEEGRTFQAPRPTKLISTSSHTMHVHEDGEKVLHLPNGSVLKVTTDASGHATHIEEDDHLHAIARPATHQRGRFTL